MTRSSEQFAQFLSNVHLEKAINDRIHSSVGDHDKKDGLNQEASVGTEVEQETTAPVISTEVSNIENC